MPDVYATISEAEPAVLEQLIDVLELRAADPQQQEMREAYLLDVAFPAGARVVEIGSFDVVFHTTLCHVPEPELALAEAFRVLAACGWVAVFDGDYATATCATGEFDPLQACVEACFDHLVHDRWLVRRLPALMQGRRVRAGAVSEPQLCGGAVLGGLHALDHRSRRRCSSESRPRTSASARLVNTSYVCSP